MSMKELQNLRKAARDLLPSDLNYQAATTLALQHAKIEYTERNTQYGGDRSSPSK